MQNNTTSATSLIIRGDNEKNNSNGSSWAENNPAGREREQDEDVVADFIDVDDGEKKVRLPRINTSNGPEGSRRSNYNGDKLTGDSSHAELVHNEDVLMNDEPSPPSTSTMPAFLVGHRSNAPIFDPSTKRNVTALVGKSAYLNCRVRNLGNKTVSAEIDDDADVAEIYISIGLDRRCPGSVTGTSTF